MICRFGGFWSSLAGRTLLYSMANSWGLVWVSELLTKIFIPLCRWCSCRELSQFTPMRGPPCLIPSSGACACHPGGISGMTSAADGGQSGKLVAFPCLCGVHMPGAFWNCWKIATRFAHIVCGRRQGWAAPRSGLSIMPFLVVAVGMITPLLYSMSLFWGDGFRTALINNWETSVLVPYFNKSWEVASQVLANFFQMV